MTDYVISVSMVFDNPDGATDDDFEAYIDAAITAYGEIGNGDLIAGGSLANRTMGFSVVLPGADEDDALARYLVDLRTALHAAGCSTPGWPVFAVKDQTLRELQPA